MNSRPATDEIISYGRAAVPALLTELNTGDAYTTVTVIELLNRLGPQAKAAVPELKRLALTPGAPYYAAQSQALTALTAIIPGDPSLIQLAGQMAEQGQEHAVRWLGSQGAAAQAELLRLVLATPEPSLELLQQYAASGAPLIDIAPQLLRALEPDEPAELQHKSSYAQDQLAADNRWAEQVLETQPAQRQAILTEWAADYARLNAGARAYLIRHLDELPAERQALVDQALTDSAYQVRQAACGVLTSLPGDRSAALAKLVDLIEREDFVDGVYQLAGFGEAGLEHLHRLAKENRINVSTYAVRQIQTNAADFGPQVIGILYDIYRTGRGSAKYEALHALNVIPEHPAAFHALLEQIANEISTVPAADQGALLHLYVRGVYGPGPGPPPAGERTWESSCAENRELMSWFQTASQQADQADVRELAAEQSAAMQAKHRATCRNPACPLK